MKKIVLCAFVIVLTVLFAATAMATSVSSAATGNWNATTTWSGAHIPVAGDDVTITGGFTVTVTANAACTSLTFSQTTANNTVNISSGKTLTVSGAITIISAAPNLNLLAVGAGILNAGSIAFTSGITTMGHEITISAGTVTVTGDITAIGSSGSATITFTSTGKLKIGGQLYQAVNVSSAGTLNTATGSTVEYNGADQNVQGFTYYHLVLSGSGRCDFLDSPHVSGNMTLSGTVNANIIVGLTIDGNVNIGNGTTCTIKDQPFAVSGTTTVGGGTSGTLATSSPNGSKIFTGLVTIAANGTWDNSYYSAITFRSGITNNGTFIGGSGIYTFNTNSQALTGTFSIDKVTVTGVTLTNNNTLTVTGALAGTGGLTNLNTGTLNIGGTVTISTLTATDYPNTVNYTGSSQTIKGTTYNGLTVNQSSGDVTLGGSTTVNYMLTMTKGNIALGGFTLTLGTPLNSYGTLTYNTGYYITGSGTFTRYFQASGQTIPASFTGDYGRFPMGDGTNDRTVLVDFSWGGIYNTGTISVSHSNATGATSVTSLSDVPLTINKRSNMSWTIAQSGLDLGTGNTMGIQITAGGIQGVTALADIALTKGSSKAGGTLVTATGSTSIPIMARTGMSLTDIANTFYIGATANSPLPVELTFFTISATEQSIVLHWSTATETNNYGFEIERKESDQWRKVGFIEGHGTTNTPQSYSFADNSASGKAAYRLKQIDRDGKFEYSKEVDVIATKTPNMFVLSQNYPNPFNPTTMISFGLPSNAMVSLKVYDALGREVSTLLSGELPAGTYSEQWSGEGFPSGEYFYRLQARQTSSGQAGVFTETKRLILLR